VDFLTLCRTPALAVQVTIQPVDRLKVDAAILFSDILVLPEAMGMELVFMEGRGGPRFPHPLRSRSDIEKLTVPDPSSSLSYVLDALRMTRRELNGRVPLIGFAGAPWTLAAYMLEGRGTADFRHAKRMLYENPLDLHILLDKISRSTALYLRAAVEAGAQVIQLFDTWGGILGRDEFHEFSLRYIRQIIEALEDLAVPVIVYCRDAGRSLEDLAESGAHGVGLDWRVDLAAARLKVGAAVALQGNLDPLLLLARPERIDRAVQKLLLEFGPAAGHIFNLGHGILPDTPVENAAACVEAVRKHSAAIRRQPTPRWT